jgi:peptidoglycan/LPS O-acetylase OafA/YrhL
MASQSKRLVGIDVLRAIAVVAVLALHWKQSALAGRPTSELMSLAWEISGSGWYGVILFFTISGFVITKTVIDRDGELPRIRIASFYVRRLARIGPAFLLFLGLGVTALMAAHRNSFASELILLGTTDHTAAFWLSIATFTLNFEYIRVSLTGHYTGWYWSIIWTLSVEEQFYLFFPLLARFAAVRARFWLAIGLLILLAVSSRALISALGAPHYWGFATPACVDALAIGVAAAVVPRFSCSRKWALRGAIVGLSFLEAGFLSIGWVPGAWKASAWACNPLLIAAGAAVVMLCCQNGEVFTHRIWAPFARIGRVSYGIYLFHLLVLYFMWPILRGMDFLPGLALFVAASTLAAEISFAVIEQPASRWIRSRWSLRGAPAGVPVAAGRTRSSLFAERNSGRIASGN